MSSAVDPTGRPNRQLAIGVLVAAAFMGGASVAAPPALVNGAAQTSTSDVERGPKWTNLTGSQQSALKPLERDWRGIGADHKQKWLEIAGQFPAMSADERQRVQARMTEWAAMTPQQRGAVRLQFTQAQQLAPSNRQARWEAYQALPEEERKRLALRADHAASSGSALRRSRSADAGVRSSSDVQAKSNVVALPETGRPVRSVAPTLVQAPNGATTTLISKRPAPPVHEQAGMPKISASPNFVNPSTLLPRRGPQGAAVIAGGASAPLARP
ncbi:MAG: DUF3106 domain-containing protein [Rhizobacter sp.]